METNCARLYFIDDLNHHYLNIRYIDNVFSLNNPSFGDFIHSIYPKELEIKDIINTVKSVSCFENNGKGNLLTKLYDKRDDLSFLIVNLPFICGNIPSATAFGVFILQVLWSSS